MLIRLTGGLGNQMFIYAFAKSLSLKGYPILLDATAYNDGLRPKTMRQDCNADSVSTATIRGGGARPASFRIGTLCHFSTSLF